VHLPAQPGVTSHVDEYNPAVGRQRLNVVIGEHVVVDAEPLGDSALTTDVRPISVGGSSYSPIADAVEYAVLLDADASTTTSAPCQPTAASRSAISQPVRNSGRIIAAASS
jgi:hypothetical protein